MVYLTRTQYRVVGGYVRSNVHLSKVAAQTRMPIWLKFANLGRHFSKLCHLNMCSVVVVHIIENTRTSQDTTLDIRLSIAAQTLSFVSEKLVSGI